MCGIAGFFDSHGSDPSARVRQVAAMATALRHRGPDDSGAWAHHEAGIALAHRRLSIIDLSPSGHQPMGSASGSRLVFNGEIYNFMELRRRLESTGTSFRGNSDTEVLLGAIDNWGVEEALRQAVGMFAFAYWHEHDRTLTLGRDRLGEKPLYYGWLRDTFVFASELRALRAHVEWRDELDHNAISLQLRYGYIPAPGTIQRGIFKLPPGTWMRIPTELPAVEARKRFSAVPAVPTAAIRPRVYWSLTETATVGAASPLDLPEEQLTDELEKRLRTAVRGQLRSDVPLGAFLSGGIDSSTVVAMMQAESSQPVRTFSIGFSESEFDESHHAARVAEHLGTDHTTLHLDEAAALDAVPELARVYDEPFSDASQLPTLLVARLARRHVTVALTGDGGDELFRGYNRYGWVNSTWQASRWLPGTLRRFGSGLLAAPARHLDALMTSGVGGAVRSPTSPGHRLLKLASLLPATTPAEMYRRAVSCWPGPEVIGKHGPDESLDPMTRSDVFASHLSYIEQMMLWDGLHYLPDDNLTKVDRATMAVALEARLPLLDHRLVEFAWRLPAHTRNPRRQSKWLLRQVLHRHVPKKLFERPKMGFSVPIGRWLQGPLRDWAESLLDPVRLRDGDIFNPVAIRGLWNEHLSGRRNHQAALWAILMFEAWRDEHSCATSGESRLSANPAVV